MAAEQLEVPFLLRRSSSSESDLEEIKNCRHFIKEAATESKKLWYIAGPAIFTSIVQYSLGATTQVFAGHLTTVELDAVSVENMVIAGFAFGIMLGMGSALETLCGQAFGAKQMHMLGVYMQRSWVILIITCICLLPLYLFATPILRFFGQDEEISVLVGTYSLYMIPQLFAYGVSFPTQKFLQAQSKVMVMATIAGVALVLHILLTWLLLVPFKLGLVGAAISLNIASWFIALGQIAYIAMGSCPGAWTGFSWGAFKDLGPFARLSIGSGVMMCVEFWFLTFLVVLVGHLRNAQIPVAAMSICINLIGWVEMVFFGFNVAISVRISNELGAGRSRAAKFSILVVVMISSLIGLVLFILGLALKDVVGIPFTSSHEVVLAVSDLAVLFSCSLLLDSIQPVLTGVAVGAGWQWLVAYINLGCYYIFGLPVGYLLAFVLDFGAKGMWCGMLAGVGLQTLILIGVTTYTNWDKEAMAAESRIRKWGGSADHESTLA